MMKLKNYLLGLALVLTIPTFSQDLLITAIFDGTLSGGNPRGLELYAMADIPDLSLYGLGVAANGGGSDGQEYTFPADAVTSGSYIHVVLSLAEFATYFPGETGDYTFSQLTINGDDPVELYYNGAVIDVYGDVAFDGTGDPWEYLDGYSYRIDGTSASTVWNAADWILPGINIYDGAATNNDASTPMPIGTYTASGSAVPGCTNSTACNYDSSATVDNGSCGFVGDSCDDMDAATVDDEYQADCSCAGIADVPGCMDSGACNYNSLATSDDGSCDYSCLGCIDNLACNYDSSSTIDDGSCAFVGDSCDDMNAATVGDEYQVDCSCSGTVPVLTNDLMITAVFDGPLTGGVPKGVELYAINDIADLSTFGIGSANNGGGTDGEEFTFPADAITAGTYIFVSSDESGAQTYFASSATNYDAGSVMSINGDDAIELFEFGIVIDVFGDINADGTGTGWEYLDSWAHRNCETGPDGSAWNENNWTYGGINNNDGTSLNSETANPMPVASYETTCPSVVPGCTNSMACNYNSNATDDDGSCELPGDSCDDGDSLTENDVLQMDCSCSGTAIVTCDPITWTPAEVLTNSSFSNGGAFTDAGSETYTVNGYCGGGCAEALDTWLVSNGFDFSGVTTSAFLFDLAESFGSTTLDLQYTTSYNGDPSMSSWTSLGTYDAAGSYSSDLSGLSGQSEVYIGFQYADDGADGYSSFTLSGMVLTGDCPTDATVFDCPTEMANFGDDCDDMDAGTIDDVIQADCSCAGTPFSLTNDLIITAVFDGPLSGGTPKGVELYVVNDIADLSTFGIGSANNGGGTDGEEWTFPVESAAAGDFIYLAAGALTEFNTFFGFDATYDAGTAVSVNGDDAVELFEFGQVIDVFGDINMDGTDTSWDHVDGWAYRNCETGPDGSTFVEANWTFSGVDALDGEANNASAVNPIPVGTYMTTCDNMEGCTDPNASNYDSTALNDDGSCEYLGCTDPLYLEYNPYAQMDDGSCSTLVVMGCIYSDADNYDPAANIDDNSCVFSGNSCPGDFNGDYVITAADLTGFLSVFGGTCTP